MEEMKNSRYYYDQQPQRFFKTFSYCLLVIIILLLIFLSYVKKNDVIQSSGIMKYTDNIYISSYSSGVVRSSVAEGKYVNSGDVILEITDGSSDGNQKFIQEEIGKYNRRLENLSSYEKSLVEKENYLINSDETLDLYSKVEYYLLQIKTDNQNSNNINKKISSAESQLKSMKENSPEYMDKKNEINRLQDEKNSYKEQSKDVLYNLTTELSKERESVTEKLMKLRNQSEIGQQSMKIMANSSGYLHYLAYSNVGAPISAFSPVAIINNYDTEKIVIESYVNSYDILKIKKNTPVNIKINGVDKYKHISGNVLEISSGSLGKGEQSESYYKVTIALSDNINDVMTQEQLQVINGMSVLTSIIYDEQTYLEWIISLVT